MNLLTINGSNVMKIHDFHRTLAVNIQALETMEKLTDINGYVRMTLNKLPAIRSDLVRLDEHWKSWNFVQLVTSLESWIQRNPVTSISFMGAAKTEKTYSTMDKTKTVYNNMGQDPAFIVTKTTCRLNAQL